MKWAQKQNGFTIVELLIVVVVIAILAAITIVSYNGISSRARDSSRASDMRAIKTAVEMYKADNGVYPDACGSTLGCNATLLTTLLVPKYINAIPQDADLTKPYSYVMDTDKYGILVHYENTPGTCKTGFNPNVTWWGTSIPTCPN